MKRNNGTQKDAENDEDPTDLGPKYVKKAPKDQRIFTPTERKILEVLSDGMPHTRDELNQCLSDDLAASTALKNHMCQLRKKLPAGQDVICQYKNKQYHYRHIRLLVPDHVA